MRRLGATVALLLACGNDREAAERYRAAWCTELCARTPRPAACDECRAGGGGAGGGAAGGGAPGGGSSGGGASMGGGSPGGGAAGGSGGAMGGGAGGGATADAGLPHLEMIVPISGMAAGGCYPTHVGAVAPDGSRVTLSSSTRVMFSSTGRAALSDGTTPLCGSPVLSADLQAGGADFNLTTGRVGFDDIVIQTSSAEVTGGTTRFAAFAQLSATVMPPDGGACFPVAISAVTAEGFGMSVSGQLLTDFSAGEDGFGVYSEAGQPLFAYRDAACAAPHVQDTLAGTPVRLEYLRPDFGHVFIRGLQPRLRGVSLFLGAMPGNASTGQPCDAGSQCSSRACGSGACLCIQPGGICQNGGAAANCCGSGCSQGRCP